MFLDRIFNSIPQHVEPNPSNADLISETFINFIKIITKTAALSTPKTENSSNIKTQYNPRWNELLKIANMLSMHIETHKSLINLINFKEYKAISRINELLLSNYWNLEKNKSDQSFKSLMLALTKEDSSLATDSYEISEMLGSTFQTILLISTERNSNITKGKYTHRFPQIQIMTHPSYPPWICLFEPLN